MLFTNYIVQMAGLAMSAALATVIPWMIPIVYSVLGGMLLNGYDPLILTAVAVLGAVLGTSSLWYLDEIASNWFNKKYGKKINSKYRINKGRIKKLHKKLVSVEKQSTMFWIVMLTTRSEIPDIFLIKYCRGKIAYPLFVLATILGKALVYIPIIYGIELLESIF